MALAAQGFTTRRPAAVTRRHILDLVDRVGVVQIDSVNVLSRAHYLPVFGRLGPYDRATLDAAASATPCHLVEYWAHEASLVPPATHRLLRWRMARWHRGATGRGQRLMSDHPGLLDEVLTVVKDRGPVTAVQVEADLAHAGPKARRDWWNNQSAARQALEVLFRSGEVTSAGRTAQFERRYAPLELVLPREVLAASDPPEEEAFAALVEIAARACGVATEHDLRDYFRMGRSETREAIDHLVAEGTLSPVEVAGVARPAWLHRDAAVPRRVAARALLAPFDPLIWRRDRAEELFGFRYRIEIYVPAVHRRFGYYVLPFLLGDRIVARVDLKADRGAGALLVRGAYAEAGAPPETAAELAAELATMAGWLGLDIVDVAPVGDLAPPLAAAVSG